MAKRIKTTLGGDRLGSGNRNKIEMHNYYRSNHNLSCSRISSMAPGVLYPMYVNIGLTGDTYDFDLNAFIRTLPTEGPMFGAFKLQVDVFSADMRLYQAILHNNTTEIGYHMDQVLMPKMNITTAAQHKTKKGAFSKSSLMYYLGMSGVGRSVTDSGNITRKINALPMLAYYDIFKNYYANKQEENAYVIVSGETTQEVQFNSFINYVYISDTPDDSDTLYPNSSSNNTAYAVQQGQYLIIEGGNLLLSNKTPNLSITQYDSNGNYQIINYNDIKNFVIIDNKSNSSRLIFEAIQDLSLTIPNGIKLVFNPKNNTNIEITGKGSVRLQDFPLKNIDLMRKKLLTAWDLGEEIIINTTDNMPYQSVVGTTEDADGLQVSKNCYPMQGLVVKCYQSDWFNNWLDSEYIEEIAQRSNVSVTGGSFSIDALNFAKKLYDHYNRIAVTGGTYDDWQKAAYGMVHYGKTEKPIYHGGLSSEVIFDEVVSSAATADEPLGSLGGRGSLKGTRGGHVVVKCNEECIIMVMVSLTPRLTYTQGNAWYLTELDSINDLHQPDFDRIGFQDLMTEQLAWWDTQIAPSGELLRTSVGKQPAWLQYQTDVNKAYGDFAEEDGKGFMVLSRLYDQDEATGGVADVTTYIDPTKYNYPFAVTSLTAQNFWGFFNFDIKVRRLMSAKQMPNV